MKIRKTLLAAALGIGILSATAAHAAPVNLNTWTAESYPAVSGFGAGVWSVAPGGNSVTQLVNGQPTIFYSDFNAIGTDVRGSVVVGNDGDDDFFGFVLGFHPGDTSNSAQYLLIDWKQGTQNFDFGAPSNTPGSTAMAGLAVSLVTGIPTADEFWGHTNFASHSGGGVEELARGITRGNTGWVDNETYAFRFLFQPTALRVFVNDVLELDINGNFSNGRLGFYNFSQSSATYNAFTIDSAPPMTSAPEPETYAMLLAGLGLLGFTARRRSRS